MNIENTKELKELEELEIEKKQRKMNILQKLGTDISNKLEDKNITEIMLNPDGKVWIEEFGKEAYESDMKISIDNAISLMKLLASYNNTFFDSKHPIINVILPTGDRFSGLGYGIVENSASFSIRKKPNKIYTLEDYLQQEVITKKQKEYLEEAIKNKENIIIVGGTSSGKTTFVNALLNVLRNLADRVLILEDTPELQCSAKNKVIMRTTEEIKMIDLVRTTMRYNPDRIIVGELRDGFTTNELLKVWNSGHGGGFATIHANNCLAGIQKLKQYLSEVVSSDQSEIILESIDVLVSLVKDPETNRRKVKEIKKIEKLDENKQFILSDLWKGKIKDGKISNNKIVSW